MAFLDMSRKARVKQNALPGVKPRILVGLGSPVYLVFTVADGVGLRGSETPSFRLRRP